MSKEKMKNKYSRKHVFDKEGNLLPIEQRTFVTNEGYKCILIDGGSKSKYVTARIEDYVFEAAPSDIKRGVVKYPLHPSVFGVGYIGIGKYKSRNGKEACPSSQIWRSMLQRCYCEKSSEKNITYKDVTVCDEWLNMQTFSKWYYDNFVPGFALDKDLLSGESKIYSPETCIFIPSELNIFLISGSTRNTSTQRGVYWCKQTSKWKARIYPTGSKSCINLGSFNSIEKAGEAYKTARAEQAQVWKDRMQGILPQHAIDRIK